jgi:hypothetical protein
MRRGIGAITDDPKALVNLALRKARTAIHDDDRFGIREASEVGWLAAAASVDVAADRLGCSAPTGLQSRRKVVADLERSVRLRAGTLLKDFDIAHKILHGACFYGDDCDPSTITGILEDVRDFVAAMAEAVHVAERPSRRRRR